MNYVFQFEQKHKKELEALLTKDPYADDSFARLGYILKESKPLGLKSGFIIVYFKTDNEKLAVKLLTDLKTIPTCTELNEADKETAVKNIEAEENNAASGFGTIFG
ncbi:MAG: hypothetical protein V1644_00170 [Candidatus Micrarchaeota archaeon]